MTVTDRLTILYFPQITRSLNVPGHLMMNALYAILDVQEISKSVNGVVSLMRRRPCEIADAEVACVRAELPCPGADQRV